MTSAHRDPTRRHDAVLLFDVTDGNPNGDPDAGNLPRLDPETMQGLVSDVAIKRKVRDFVSAIKGQEDGYRILIQNETYLNDLYSRGYEASGLSVPKKYNRNRTEVTRVRDLMAATYFDVRTFGAVMSTGPNAGQVRGPVQITFARSVDPVALLDMSITRIALTDEAGAVSEQAGAAGPSHGTMGRKPLLPYGLYRANVFVSPLFAKQTGFSSEDLALVWHSLASMWDLDRSAARGMMACRGLHVFSHTSPWGNAPAQSLLDRVQVGRRDQSRPPRAFSDYTVDVITVDLPDAVTYTDLTAAVALSA